MQLHIRNYVYFPFPFRSFQPGSPPSRPYEAPTPGAGWASTPGGNYSEAGTPRDSSAYGIATSYPFKTNCIYLFFIFMLILYSGDGGCIFHSQCSKPVFTINTWWAAYDTKFSILSSGHSWRTAYDSRHWWYGHDVSSFR